MRHVAGLAIAAHLLDATCMRQLGFSLDSLSLILMSGFITTAHRQVSDNAPVLFIPICLNLLKCVQGSRHLIKPRLVHA